MPYAEVEPDEVKARIARGEDVFLLDVREPDEVAEPGPIPSASTSPSGELGDRLDEVPGDGTIVVACHVGGRSATAAKALSDSGMDGGEPHGRGGGLGRRRRRSGLTGVSGAA